MLCCIDIDCLLLFSVSFFPLLPHSRTREPKMGNCQAIDAAALVIQHPSGRIERLYWPITASEVMRTNPGHYVSLIIPLPTDAAGEDNSDKQRNDKKVRFTRVKLLRPTETLTLGHAYRLITSQEVMKVLRAKRYAKMKKHLQQQHSAENTSQEDETSSQTGPEEASDPTKSNQMNSGRMISMNTAVVRPKPWRPSLECIEEVAS